MADDLAAFLAALHRCRPMGRRAQGAHNYHRGGPNRFFDPLVRQAIAQLDRRIDTDGAIEVWELALESSYRGVDVWVHGDMTGSNLLVRDGRLSAVIDFGCAAVGDPACDLAVAWTTFEGPSRERFKCKVDIGGDAWTRARAWVLWKAMKGLAALPDDHPRNDGTRLGWRCSSKEVIEALIADPS